MKVKCLLIGAFFLFIAGMLTTQSYAEIDPDTIVGMWLFDESKGDTATDSSGNGNDGELVGNPEWVDGKFGNALEFDGTGSHVNILNSDPLLSVCGSNQMNCEFRGSLIKHLRLIGDFL